MPIKLNGVTIIDEQDLADKNLSNLTDAGNIVAAKASMPSNDYDDLTLGASGTEYTAPSDGWVYIRGKASATYQYIAIIKDPSVAAYEASVMWAVSNSSDLYANAPLKKGDKFKVNYTMGGTSENDYFRFYYAEGSKSEQ